MDNASKALIMAGAILIAVMLISLGVLLYNRAQGVAEDAMGSVDSLGKEAFNAQFTPFLGNEMSASSVKSLINKVNSSKRAGVTISLDNGSGCITEVKDVNNKYTYDVNVGTNGMSNGVIEVITIKQHQQQQQQNP